MMVKLVTDFPGGNGAMVCCEERCGGQRVTFRAETKYYEPQPNWFYFRLTGLRGSVTQLEFSNAAQCLDDNGVQGWKKNHPVYRASGAEWKRVERVNVTLTPERCYKVTFDVPVEAAEMEFAYGYPYDTSHLMNTLNECPSLRKTVIGYSAKGRELLRVSNGFGDSQKTKKGVYVVARQHAAEVGGAWVTDGMMRFLASPEGQALTANQMWWFIPIIDPDGVEEGAYGKDQLMGDLNRAWGNPFPKRVELHAVIHDIEQWSTYSEPGFFLDMHSPGNDKHGIKLLLQSAMTPEQRADADLLVERYNQHLSARNMQPALFRYKETGKDNTSSQTGLMGALYAIHFADVASATVETSCWGPRDESTSYSISDYHAMGECMVRALSDVFSKPPHK